MKIRSVAACLGACLALSSAFVSSAALADGAALGEATDVQKQSAQIRYLAGMDSFKAGQFEQARKGFNDSFETVASPNSLLMVVRCLGELKRHVEAYEQANKTARLADAAAAKDPKYLQTAKAARDEAARLRTILGFVSLMSVDRLPAGTAVKLGDRTIERKDWSSPIPVEPGEVVLTVNGKAAKPVTVAAGGQSTIDASTVGGGGAPPPPGDDDDDDDTTDEYTTGTYRGPSRLMMAGVAGGVGVAGFIMTAAFGSLAQGKFDDLALACPAGQCPTAALEDEANTGKTYQTVANTGLVFGIIGAVAAGGFVAWHFIEPDAPEKGADGKELSNYGPKLRIGPGTMFLEGSF